VHVENRVESALPHPSKLKYHKLLSSSAFDFNLRCYHMVALAVVSTGEGIGSASGAGASALGGGDAELSSSPSVDFYFSAGPSYTTFVFSLTLLSCSA